MSNQIFTALIYIISIFILLFIIALYIKYCLYFIIKFLKVLISIIIL